MHNKLLARKNYNKDNTSVLYSNSYGSALRVTTQEGAHLYRYVPDHQKPNQTKLHTGGSRTPPMTCLDLDGRQEWCSALVVV